MSPASGAPTIAMRRAWSVRLGPSLQQGGRWAGIGGVAGWIDLVQRARSAVRPNDSHMKPSEPPQMRHAATMRDHFDVVMQVATVIGDPHRFVRGIQAHL